jgi:hypothetical protein
MKMDDLTLIDRLRKEANRNAQMQGDKAHQSNQRRKTFRGRNRLFTHSANRLTELESLLRDVSAAIWKSLPHDDPDTSDSGLVALGERIDRTLQKNESQDTEHPSRYWVNTVQQVGGKWSCFCPGPDWAEVNDISTINNDEENKHVDI